MAMTKVKEFQATLERSKNALNWVIVRIPFSVVNIGGTRGQLKVHVRVNGMGFQSCLFPSGTGVHFMIVNQQMQRAAGIRLGDKAEFVLEPDLSKRKVEVPAELQKLLKQERELATWYATLNDSTRKDINRWIAQPKTSASRDRRTEQIAERMMETMEAEVELPPLIRRALALNSAADDGWRLMTAAQRRSHLLGIFYYRTPGGRERRLQKALEAATRVAEKRGQG